MSDRSRVEIVDLPMGISANRTCGLANAWLDALHADARDAGVQHGVLTATAIVEPVLPDHREVAVLDIYESAQKRA